MEIHSSILAWKIPWMEEPGGLSPYGRKELDMTKRLHFTIFDMEVKIPKKSVHK